LVRPDALARPDVFVPIRLIISRQSPEATETRHKTLRTPVSRMPKTLDPKSLVAAAFLILSASLPAKGYPAEKVLAAYRLRRQIELEFKRLKSPLHVDKPPTHTGIETLF
jgi:hypothetical protein